MTETEQDTRPVLPAWTLGWRLRRSLEHAGMDVQDMAEILEVSRSTLSRWMHDEIEPKRLYLKEWAELTHVTVDWLLEDTPKGSGLGEHRPVPAGGGTITDNNNYEERPRRRRRSRATTLPDNHSYRYFRCPRVGNPPLDVEVNEGLSPVDFRHAKGINRYSAGFGGPATRGTNGRTQ